VSVRRTRRLSLEQLAAYLLEGQLTVLDWPAVFGNANPVEIEVGFGKGLFLVTAAHSRPDINFFGIEIARKYQLFAATRMARRGLRNVRLAKADARQFLRDFVPDASAQAVHVYFPDPWWKKRHLKRRVFTGGFAQQCERVLLPGGRLYVVTDVQAYYEIITELVTEHTRLQLVAPPAPSAAAHDLDYLTNFERKFRKEGRAIYRATYERQTM
jgi:tRNA (guanine-N7-)-methyltransferase